MVSLLDFIRKLKSFKFSWRASVRPSSVWRKQVEVPVQAHISKVFHALLNTAELRVLEMYVSFGMHVMPGFQLVRNSA